MYEALKDKLQSFFADKQHIVVVQGDNPDADSLASSLALEQLLHEQGINTTLYCSIDVGHHLRYLSGWDRVTTELPAGFDAWILVDCEYLRLLDNAAASGVLGMLKPKPLLIFDHHSSPSDIEFASLVINDPSAGSTGQVIYNCAQVMGWEVSAKSAEMIAVSILADTLGFTSEVMHDNPSPLYTMAELVQRGVHLGELNERRLRQFQITPEIFNYKADLMKRVEFHFDNQIATIDIPHDEIKEYSMDYNPTVVLDETRMIAGLAVTIGFKSYERNGSIYKITGRIRCGYGYRFARELAAHFKDGGGHPYAAGFKVEGRDLNFQEIKKQAIMKAKELIDLEPTQAAP